MTNATIPAPRVYGETSEARLTSNIEGLVCSWCGDAVKAAFAVESGPSKWVDGVCTKHVVEFFPELLPEDFRPATYATTFRLKVITSVGADTMSGAWESYPTFQALFKASREITRGDYFAEVWSSSNKHYRRTGHHRMVFRPTARANKAVGVGHVIIHVIVK